MTILKYFAFCLLVTIYTTTYGQPQVAVFAFEQSSLPGTVPTGVTDEQGRRVTGSRAGVSTNFFIYIAHPASASVRPVSLWIRGRAFDFTQQSIASPVEIRIKGNTGSTYTRTMVPRTSMNVRQVVVGGEAAKQPIIRASLKKRLTGCQVIIGYVLNGKTYYATLKKITELEPLMNQ